MKQIVSFCWIVCSCTCALGQAPEFSVAKAGYDFEFPRDHGAHPDFRIEWWYLTGHLYAEDRVGSKNNRFGFQATWFRVGREPGASAAEMVAAGKDGVDPGFGTKEFHMAHATLFRDSDKTFWHEERLNRGGWDAHAAVGHLDLRNGNWTLRSEGKGKGEGEGEGMRLQASVRGGAAYDLVLRPAKPHVVFGENGVSRKGADPSAASLYITYPRLQVEGILKIEGKERKVRGEAWMDHEISSSQLDRNQVGWDWASVQFEPEKEGGATRELMVYILRDGDGKPDAFSKLVWIGEDGKLTHLGPDKFSWTAKRSWTSPETKGTYPIDVLIKTVDPATGKPFEVRLAPLADHTEVVGHLGGVHYWEGPCRALGADGRELGSAFVELTGYAGSLGSVLK